MKSKSSPAKCPRCGKKAAAELKSSAEPLCKRCFTERFEKRVKKTIRTSRLLESTDKTAVALSGGKDSAVALFMLHELTKNVPRSKLVAVTIDPGVRGGKKSIDAAKKLCSLLEVEHHVYSFKEEFGCGMEEIMKKARKEDRPAHACTYCGILRRKLLNRKAKDLKASKIATGHNMDDEIQTALMNFIRGDYKKMAMMGAYVGVLRDEGFVPRIKPLRDRPEEEVRLYADFKGLPYSSSRCPYSGEAFRGTIRKIVSELEENHPGSKFQILRSTDRLISFLRDRSAGYPEMGRCAECGEPASGTVCRFCETVELFGL